MDKNEIKLKASIPSSLMDKLNAYCKSNDLSLKDAVEKALDKYMTSNYKKPDKYFLKTP